MKGHSDIIFARRLRQFRLHASLTQQHLADQMTTVGHHMANSTISNIESGRRLVTIGEAVQFAATLAAGNAAGDIDMLRAARFALVVHHDDDVRIRLRRPSDTQRGRRRRLDGAQHA